ncbi:MAG: hypothetical protein Tsb0021_14620 [Chlamydiales bacterium]
MLVYSNGFLEGKLIVEGQAKLSFPADRASITVGAVTEDPDVTKAQQENNKKIAKLTNALNEMGFPKTDYETSQFIITPKYLNPSKEHQDSPKLPQISSYEVRNLIRIQTDNFAQLMDLISKATQLGVNVIEDISFSLKNPTEAQNQAIKAAIRQARTFAQAAAEASESTLGEITEIRVSPSSIFPRMAQSQRYMLATSAYETAIHPGDVEVNASVTITYSMKEF